MKSKKRVKKALCGLNQKKLASFLEEGRILAEELHKQMEPMFQFSALELRTPVY